MAQRWSGSHQCRAKAAKVRRELGTLELYVRLISTLGRHPARLLRAPGEHEYAERLAADSSPPAGRVFLINSPENPSGYVMSREDWDALDKAAEAADAWIIHDEVYDTLVFDRPHLPARARPAIASRSIQVNSCSKKFGVPGLRIGWVVADAAVIEAAAKAHDYLCLGVNIMAERIAERLLSDPEAPAWLEGIRRQLAARLRRAQDLLGPHNGFAWPRRPRGGMFLFPDVSMLHHRLPAADRGAGDDAGMAVAQYLLRTQKIATVPGSMYGTTGTNHLRLTTGGDSGVFEAALHRLGTLTQHPAAC